MLKLRLPLPAPRTNDRPLHPPHTNPPLGSYEEDFNLAKEAGCNAFRLSIEWARIEPRRGYIDLEAVARCVCVMVGGVTPSWGARDFSSLLE
jgi:hypothetical protein